MIISHRHRFIFVKTRKTAGTSLEIGLAHHCGAEDVITPVLAKDEAIRREVGARGPQNVRVPLRRHSAGDLARAVWSRSAPRFYNHMPASEIMRRVGRRVWDAYFTFTIERNPYDKAISRYYWSTRNREPRPSLDAYLATAPARLLSNWGTYTVNDRPAVDFVIRFEHLQEDVAEVASRLGLGAIDLPRAKGDHRADRDHYSRILSPAARDRIEVVCAREIRHFGYTWADD